MQRCSAAILRQGLPLDCHHHKVGDNEMVCRPVWREERFMLRRGAVPGRAVPGLLLPAERLVPALERLLLPGASQLVMLLSVSMLQFATGDRYHIESASCILRRVLPAMLVIHAVRAVVSSSAHCRRPHASARGSHKRAIPAVDVLAQCCADGCTQRW